MTRRILLVTHTGRDHARERAAYVTSRLVAAGVEVHALGDEDADPATAAREGGFSTGAIPPGTELVLGLGGDGTLLRGAELARSADLPLLGVNFGHVGFLAETEPEDLDDTLDRILRRDYAVEERMTLDVAVRVGDRITHRDWALNEAAVNKTDAVRMLECVMAIDGRPVSRFGCDGLVCATPTGSTAYAFSGGGPVVWPRVEALLVVPISAHALFARPLVTAPDSTIAVDILPVVEPAVGSESALLWCDGRRLVRLASGSRVEVCRGERPVRLARLHDRPFTDRLVAKFSLPVGGWRGSAHSSSTAPGDGPESRPAQH